MLASSTETAVPENPTLTATPVGIVYTFEAGSGVWVKVAVMPPNDSASVHAMACFAVGLIAYTMDVVRVLAIGDAVVRVYVAPDPVVL
jgi:predicted membrane chloride channel (bestrophin family)